MGNNTKSIPVWLYPASSEPSGPNCAIVTIEEHTECQCGCAINADSCKANQIFQESKCACTCTDHQARQACYRKSGLGWKWNEESCQCMCKPREEWPQCATGYQFDPLDTCECISISEYAGSVLIIVVILLAVGLITTISSIIVCHRQKIGLFKHQRNQAIMERIRRKSSAAAAAEQGQKNNSPLLK